MVSIVDQDVGTMGPQGPDGVDRADKPGDPSEHFSAEDLNNLFCGIWYELICLIAKLRDALQNYHAVQMRYGWDLQISQLNTKMGSINESYKAGLVSGIMAVIGGVVGVVAGGLGITQHIGWTTIGSTTTEGTRGAGGAWSAYYTKEASIQEANANFGKKLADQYSDTLVKTLQRARSLIGDILKAAQEAIQLYGSLLQSLNSNK